jgi:sigma-B regulation protein RsbU (phosphoserine phosphatase)
VGLTVLALRLEDRNAWLLALLFAGFICGAPLFEGSINPHLRGWVTFYKMTFGPLGAGIFCYFFLTFPVPSLIDRRMPQLKSVLLSVTAAYSIPLGLACLVAGGLLPYYSLVGWVSKKALAWPLNLYALGLNGLGFVSLIWNSVRPATAEARRKTRVILWGTLVGVGPLLVTGTVSLLANFPVWEIPFWVLAVGVISLALMPLSFAYAVVKHRVLEIPVLLKRSARYLIVQRGFVVLTVLGTTAAIWLFITVFTRFFHISRELGLPIGMGVGIIFGAIAAALILHLLPRVNKRIDRAFFRSAYDARQVLEDLAHKIRKSPGREQLATLLESEINQALHPTSVAVYLEASDGRLSLQPDGLHSGFEPSLSPDAPLLRELAVRGWPWEVPPLEVGDAPSLSVLGSVRQECLVPIVASDGRVTGIIALGTRLSEEPYSREDRRLLTSVASQAGIALENIRLAEEMAERIEAERRAGQEMEFARQVQARLFPQKLPPLQTLEYAGSCSQARQVGGDYYDFLDLRPGRLALVLADIAGKGVPGALLMANLQANLRSQYALALDDLVRLLESVNRLFYENTADSNYATLVFADYDDSSRRLRYVNCGHLPPLLLRAGELSQDGVGGQLAVERLEPTCTVLGLFDKWKCGVADVQLAPNDTVVLYTDGVTEARSASGEEFGEARLIETLRAHGHLPVSALLQTLVTEVQKFSGSQQEDDITLIVARGRSLGHDTPQPA